MDLPRLVADQLGIDQARAERGLSALFMSIRMAVDPATYATLTAAFPGAASWMRGAQLGGGRTGEVLALAGPEALQRQLQLAGFTSRDMQSLGRTVGTALREALSHDAVERIVARIPLLKGAE